MLSSGNQLADGNSPLRAVGGQEGVEVDLRRVATLDEYRQCEELQDLIWGPRDVVRVPGLVMMTAQNNGGMVIGAFAGGRLVGFVCAYPGLTESGRVRQCSQLMAVHPEFQSARVGYRLKLAQRAATLNQGVELVTWTFDPLASLNAYLNVKKLGGVSSQYVLDCYGTVDEGLNGGLATDRLLVEWWVKTPWVEERLHHAQTPPRPRGGRWVNDVALQPRSGLPVNRHLDLERDEPALRVEIPPDFQAVKSSDPGLARAWRQETREVFQTYLPRGYRVVYFDRQKEHGRCRYGYLLQRPEASAWREAPPPQTGERMWESCMGESSGGA